MRDGGVSTVGLTGRMVGSALLMFAGVLVYTQTHLGIFETAAPEFLSWLRALGIALLFHGALLFVAHFLGLADHREGIGLALVFNAIYFIFLLQLFFRPSMVPVLAYNEAQAYLLEDSELKDTLVRSVVGAVLLFTLLGVLSQIKALVFLSKGRRDR